jgi:Ca2+-binding EF-hand superfamily protein
MRFDDAGVTLAMLGFVGRLKSRRRQSERRAPAQDGSSGAPARRVRDPPLGNGLVSARFVGKLQRARKKESARQQEIARQAALREDAAAVTRGRASTFASGRSFGDADVIPEEDVEDGEEEASNDDWDTGLLWSDAALGVKWKACESLLDTAIEQCDVQHIRMAINHARDLTIDEPQLWSRLANMEKRVVDMKPSEVAQNASLLWNPQVVQQLNRFWDATALDLQSKNRTGHKGRWGKVYSLLVSKRGMVTATDYKELHIRISRAMHRGPDPWSYAAAVTQCEEEWLADVARFGGQVALNAWFSKVKNLLAKKSHLAVRETGWRALFDVFDRDGNGSLNCTEFTSGIRFGAKVAQHVVSDVELRRVFRFVDSDRSGSVDASEFLKWMKKHDEIEKALASQQNVSNVMKATARTVDAIQKTAADTVAQLGWTQLFNKFDVNEDGSLSKGEFARAVRAECKLSPQELAEEELWMVFDMIDVDHGGTIDAIEFVRALSDESVVEDLSLSLSGFRMCILELADTWAREKTAASYVEFFNLLFEDLTEKAAPARQTSSDAVLGANGTVNYRLRTLAAIRIGAMHSQLASMHSELASDEGSASSGERKRIPTQRQNGPRERVALSLNSFGNQDIIDDQSINDAMLELRVADFGGGLVARRSLVRSGRVRQGHVQSNGGGRAAFSMEKTAGKENQNEQRQLKPRAPSPRWGMKTQAVRPQSARQQSSRPQSARPQAVRPQSARDSRRSNQVRDWGVHDADARRRPPAHSAESAVSNRHAMALDQGSTRARVRADGNKHIRAARPPQCHTTGRKGDSALDPRLSAADLTAQCDADTEAGALLSQQRASADSKGASAQAVEDVLVSSCPIGHAWRKSRNQLLDRNQLLAKRAKVAARAGPLVGRARSPSRDCDVATTQDQPKARTESRPQSATAKMTAQTSSPVAVLLQVQPSSAAAGSSRPQSAAARIATVKTSSVVAALSQVQPSSAAVRLQERPKSAGTVLMHAPRPTGAGTTRAPAPISVISRTHFRIARPASATPRLSS